MARIGTTRSAAVMMLLLAVLACAAHARAAMIWASALGGEWADEAYSVQPTLDGGCILAGRTYSFDRGPGYGDAWVVKLRRNGKVQWQESMGEGLWDELRSIRQTPDGGFVAAGTRYPPGTSQEAWVMKLDADGAIAWQRTYGRDDHYDGALQIRPTADGGFIVAGWTQAYALGDRQKPWLLKLDGKGEIEWQQEFEGSHLDLLLTVEQTSDGGYVLAGGTYSYSALPGLYSDAWVVKLHADGDVDWQQAYGGSFDEAACAIRQTADGGYVVAAWSATFGAGLGDFWVLRLDAAGAPVWQRSCGGARSDVPQALAEGPDGDIVVAGYTASFGAGRRDGWILALSPTGDPRWQKSYGGAEDDLFFALEPTADGLVATGSTRSFGAGEEDLWVVRLDADGNLPRCTLGVDSCAGVRTTDADLWYLQVLPAATAVLPAASRAPATPTEAAETDLRKLTRTKSARLRTMSGEGGLRPMPVHRHPPAATPPF
jgi:hypothetical protein